jgi:DNA invertase Pin-like site-specific DNA recombinase
LKAAIYARVSTTEQETDNQVRQLVESAERPGFNRRFVGILERLSEGSISKRVASTQLGIGHASLLRLLEDAGRGDLVERRTKPGALGK